MQDKINAVKAFHTAFKIGHRETPKADLGLEKNMLRYKLMREENEEYLEAANDNDLVEVADALGDMLYILCGTIIEHGLQYKIEEVFDEIQRSNMSKLGEDGEPIYRDDGKVLKGPNYFKPHIKDILTKERGFVTVDDRNNQIIITDTNPKLTKAKEIISKTI